MHAAAVRLINRERARLFMLPIAPGERDGLKITVLLDELAKLKSTPTPAMQAELREAFR